MIKAVRLIFIFCMVQSILFAEEWNTVYLASYPRSGNHWVRFLVEEATHITTSSTYRDKDYPHLANVFPWGAYCTYYGYDGNCRYPTKNDPVLIKTHYPYFQKQIRPTPKLAICLIRHPVDAFWSFHTYRGGKQADMDKELLMQFIQSWRSFYEFWESQPGVLFIRYEDLHANPGPHLSLILQTAGYTFTDADVERAITKYSPQGVPLKHSVSYDSESIEIINKELGDILARYHYNEM